jgi:hypothetical protein
MRHITIAFLALSLVSCSVSKSLQKSLRKYNSSIDYLHDSSKSSCPRNNQVYVTINNTPLDSITTVSKLNNLVLPFIVFNHFEVTSKVKLGQSSIQEDYNTFFKSSINEESKRSGCFSVTNTLSSDTIHTLELTIDTCSTTSKYRRTTTFLFLFIAYAYNISESGSPAETHLHVHAKFKKGNSLIYEKEYSFAHNQPFVYLNSKKLLSDFSANMVEGLSLTTKVCIDQIVSDINLSLYGSLNPQMNIDVTSNQKSEEVQTTSEVEQSNSQKVISSGNVITSNDQLNIGDKVKYYNYGFNSYLKGVVKKISAEKIYIEYEFFGKLKTVEINKSDVKKL